MSRAVRITNILVVVIPFVAFVAALATLWNEFVGPLDLAIGFGMYAITLLGVTIGFHRYLTHHAFRTSKPVEYTFAILGSMAIEGPVVELGRRPPQAPRPHRPGRRPALTARLRPRRARHPQGTVARARRLAVGGPRRGRAQALRARPDRGPRDQDHQPQLRPARSAVAGCCRSSSAGRSAARCTPG